MSGERGRAVDVPTTAFKAGMRGGAPPSRSASRSTRRWRGGARASRGMAVAMLDQLDMGPEPDAGYPQFWEARARARGAAVGGGAKPRAEAEWAALCAPAARPRPPRTA